MATIRQRSGSWQVIVKRKGHGTYACTFDTRADAERWGREKEVDIDRGVFVSSKEAERTTLDEALDRYEREVIPSKRGAKQEHARIRLWKRTDLAKRFLTTIQGKDIAAYRDARLKGDPKKNIPAAAPNTIRHELAILSHVFTIAVKEWGLTSLVNPVKQIRMPKMPRGRDRRVGDEEIESVIRSSESAVLPGIVRIALETAMRQAEIANMEWTHVDLKKRVLSIPVAKVEPRRIPLSDEAVRVLHELPRRLDGKVWGVTPHAIAAAWRRAVARARAAYVKRCEDEKTGPHPDFLVDMTFHDLRHEATSRFFEQGLNPMQVAAITGHKTLQMLQRYTHLKAEDLAKVVRSNAGSGS